MLRHCPQKPFLSIFHLQRQPLALCLCFCVLPEMHCTYVTFSLWITVLFSLLESLLPSRISAHCIKVHLKETPEDLVAMLSGGLQLGCCWTKGHN